MGLSSRVARISTQFRLMSLNPLLFKLSLFSFLPPQSTSMTPSSRNAPLTAALELKAKSILLLLLRLASEGRSEAAESKKRASWQKAAKTALVPPQKPCSSSTRLLPQQQHLVASFYQEKSQWVGKTHGPMADAVVCRPHAHTHARS